MKIDEKTTIFSTSLGWTAIVWSGARVGRLTFGHDSAESAYRVLNHAAPQKRALTSHQKAVIRRLDSYANGKPEDFSDIDISLRSYTAFQRRVLRQCRRIAWGRTTTYAELAARSGCPGAARAVGNVMARNPLPLIIPCHRVLGTGNRLGGFSAPSGLVMKKRLLALERAAVVLG